MSNNYRQLICSFILEKWAYCEDRILISHDKIFVYKCNFKRNGWATSSEIAVASLLLDLEINVW
jgi:hypothetical protein